MSARCFPELGLYCADGGEQTFYMRQSVTNAAANTMGGGTRGLKRKKVGCTMGAD